MTTSRSDRQQLHDAALGRWFMHVLAIKEHLAKPDPDMYAVAECWAEIPQDDQLDLWLAPTKGGIFTTEERRAIKERLPKTHEDTWTEYDNYSF